MAFSPGAFRLRGSRRGLLWRALPACLALSIWAAAQQGGAPEPLAIRTTVLPKAFVRTRYHFPLQAAGGVAPLKWEVSSGFLPKGLNLAEDGELSGVPTETGNFHFAVAVSDSGIPAQQRTQELELQVVAPLMAQWSRYPTVTDQRIEGAVTVSNQTDQDFDLTMIVVAVNEVGRAIALGYQHFTLNKNTIELEIPFGDTLPSGSYEIDVDVVGEVAVTNSIHRARLVTDQRLQVQPAP